MQLTSVEAACQRLLKDITRTTPQEVERVLAQAAPHLGGLPELADVGIALLSRPDAALRMLGCAWLARLPSVDTIKRLAAVALDPSNPPQVRDRAITALGDRAVRDGHPATLWSADAVQIADDALYKLADVMGSGGHAGSPALPLALRHVASEASAAVIARAPALWGDAIECFATPALARVLSVSFDDLPVRHRLRALRLVAATLGEEALPLLRTRDVRPDERVEARLLGIAVGGEAQVGALDDLLIDEVNEVMIAAARGRARWQLANRGVVPSVRGLRVARVTATLPAGERAAACGRAADDLGALVAFEHHAEAYVYAEWAWLARGAGDPVRAARLVAAHPASRAIVAELYLEDLARRGRVARVVEVASELGVHDRGALLLAIHGRPLAALELAATAPMHTAALRRARALACYRVARPDLAERVLVEDAVAGDGLPDAVAGVLALAQPAPDGAEPDGVSLGGVDAVERRLARELRGATVYVAGGAATGVRERLVAAGASVVAGLVPGVDFYVGGDELGAEVVARLEGAGARRLRGAELRDP